MKIYKSITEKRVKVTTDDGIFTMPSAMSFAIRILSSQGSVLLVSCNSFFSVPHAMYSENRKIIRKSEGHHCTIVPC